MNKPSLITLLFILPLFVTGQNDYSMSPESWGICNVDANNTPYTLYVDRYKDFHCTCKYYNNRQWIDLSPSYGLSSNHVSNSLSLLFDNKNRPIVGFIETLPNQHSKLIIKRFENDKWNLLGKIDIKTYSTDMRHAITLDSSGRIYFAFADYSSSQLNANIKEPYTLSLSVGFYSEDLNDFVFLNNDGLSTFQNQGLWALQLKWLPNNTLLLAAGSSNSNGAQIVLLKYAINALIPFKDNCCKHWEKLTTLSTKSPPISLCVAQDGTTYILEHLNSVIINNRYHGTFEIRRYINNTWSYYGNRIENIPGTAEILADNTNDLYLKTDFGVTTQLRKLNTKTNSWELFSEKTTDRSFSSGRVNPLFFDKYNRPILRLEKMIILTNKAFGSIPKYFILEENLWQEIWE